jgi:hypothetical protein
MQSDLTCFIWMRNINLYALPDIISVMKSEDVVGRACDVDGRYEIRIQNYC